MAVSTIPFMTGNQLSPEDPLVIAPGTAVASFSVTEQNSKYRVWNLLAAANPANLPTNRYRGFFVVDNSKSTQDAVLSQNGTPVRTVPAGATLELWRPIPHVGTEAFTVTLGGTTVLPCIVTERSFL